MFISDALHIGTGRREVCGDQSQLTNAVFLCLRLQQASLPSTCVTHPVSSVSAEMLARNPDRFSVLMGKRTPFAGQDADAVEVDLTLAQANHLREGQRGSTN
jgi:hypothetical protein